MSENWRSKYFERSLDACIVMGLDGCVVDWNQKAVEMFGWTREETVGKLLAELIIPEAHWNAHRTGIEHYKSSGQGPVINQRTRLKAISKAGVEFITELTVTVVGKGADTMFIGALRDVPEAAHPPITDQSSSVETSSSTTIMGSLESAIERCLVAVSTVTHWPIGHALLVDEARKSLIPCGVHDHARKAALVSLVVPPSLKIYKSGEGLAGQAWEKGKPLWMTTEKNPSTYKNFISQNPDLNTAIAVPLSVDGEIAFILELATDKIVQPDIEILNTVKGICEQLIPAIEQFRWRRERRLMAAIVESSSDAIIGKNSVGTIISWNKGAENLFQYTEDEAIGNSLALILPEGFTEEEEEIQELLRTSDRLAAFEAKRRRKDGTMLDVSLTISTIRDLEGKLLGTATIERDITPLRKAMQTLQDREERLRLLMESSGEAIYGIDLEGKCTFANRACTKILGYQDGEEILGNNMHELVHHSHKDGTKYEVDKCPIVQAVRTGKSVHVTHEVYWKVNHTPFPVEYWSSPIRRGNEIVGAVVVFEDSTGRLEAERAKAELATIVESTGDAIIGRDHNGIITSWNLGAELLYGYKARECLGLSYSELLVHSSSNSVKMNDTHFTSANILSIETTRKHMDGTLLNVGITESAILDSRGQLVGTSTIERDISRRKQREIELMEAKRVAESANIAKSDFLANISHELRTPMNAVLGMLGIALDEQLPDPLRDYLSTARESAETLLFLLNDLLDLSRMEAGPFELDPEPFSLRETLQSVMKTLSFKAFEKGLELNADIKSDVPDYLLGDGFRLRQVITNLAGNAIKFTEQGEVTVLVQSEKLSDQKVRLICSVRDTGIGIPAKDHAKIFESFTQSDSSSTRLRTGSGLGLSISRKLIQKMGGTLSVESEIGKGSTFQFECVVEVLPKADLATDGHQFAGLRAIVVDDNLTSRNILSDLLQSWFIQPMVAASAAAALRMVKELKQSKEALPLVIVDALMPGTDGFTLIEQLKTQESQIVTILMVSSADRLTFERRCENLGVNAFIEKPVSQSDVFDAILKAFNGPLSQNHAPESVVQQATRKLKILVAEDTLANQKVVRLILEKRGHHVVIAVNGREAYEKVQHGDFDVVLMDVQMPTMDGFQATTAIRGLKEHHKIPIIAMTAHARREDRMKCLASGMNGYISKPIDTVKLLKLIEKLTSQNDKGSKLKTKERQLPVDSVIDINIALKRMGGDTEILNMLATGFIEDAPLLIANMREAYVSKDYPELHRAVHSLKGLGANFEANALTAATHLLEEIAQKNLDEDCEELINDIAQKANRVSAALKEQLNLNS